MLGTTAARSSRSRSAIGLIAHESVSPAFGPAPDRQGRRCCATRSSRTWSRAAAWPSTSTAGWTWTTRCRALVQRAAEGARRPQREAVTRRRQHAGEEGGVMGASLDLGDPRRAARPRTALALALDSLADADPRRDGSRRRARLRRVPVHRRGQGRPADLRLLRAALTRRLPGIGTSGSSDRAAARHVLAIEHAVLRLRRWIIEATSRLGPRSPVSGRRSFEATRRDLNQVLAQDALQELGTQPEPFLHAVSLAMANPKWSLADTLRRDAICSRPTRALLPGAA